MDTRTETRQIRLARWRKIFEEKASSGLTAKEFCAINNISKDAYYYWLKLVRQEVLSQMKQPSLVELKQPATIDDLETNINRSQTEGFKPQLTITVKDLSIQINNNTPKELLTMVIEVVSNAK